MDSNPYVEARKEWDERYADLVLGKRNWQIAAGGLLLLSLILASGIVWLSNHSFSSAALCRIKSTLGAFFRLGVFTTTLFEGPNGDLLGSIGESWSIFIQSQSRAESNSA